MDDLHLLLPGLKVSSGLIRQRPLSPTEQDGCQDAPPAAPVGSKRRHNALGSEDDDRLSDGSEAKRHHQHATADVTLKQRLPRRLRGPSFSSPARDPIFAGLEAGITSNMLNELSDSPKVSPSKPCPCPLSDAGASDSTRGLSEDALTASAACADTQDEGADLESRLPSASEVSSRLHQFLQSDAKPGPRQQQTLASCPCSLPPRPSSSASSAATATVTLSCASSLSDGDGWSVEASVTPDMFQKRKSAPSRMEAHPGTKIIGEATLSAASAADRSDTACTAATPSPTTPSAAPTAPSATPGHATPPRGQQYSLSKAEKWHERINVATMRLRARSLPVTPERERAVQSLAAQ